MKPTIAALLLLALAPFGAWTKATPAAAPPPPSLALTGVTLIDGTGAPARPRQTILIQGTSIVALGPDGALALPEDARRVELPGRFAIPALWDMHVHLANRPEGQPPAEALLPLFVAHGVLGVRDMGGDLERLQRLRETVAAARVRGPRIVASGPFVDGPGGAAPYALRVANAAEARAAVRRLASLQADFVKLQAGLAPEAWRAAIEEARATGLPVAGHVPDTVSAWEVPGSGQRTIEHVSPALPSDASLLLACSSREAELRRELLALATASAAADARIEDIRARERALQEALLGSYDSARASRLFASLADSGVVVVPTLVWSQTLLPRTADDLATDVPLAGIPPALRERWQERRRSYVAKAPAGTLAFNARIAARSLELVGALRRAGVGLLAGTDGLDAFVVPGEALHRELELLVAAGLPPIAALQAATRDAARLLGLERERGTLEPGRAADLVLLEGDPLADIRATRRIAAVVQGGELLDRAALDALLVRPAELRGGPPRR